MEGPTREIIAGLITPLILVVPDWDTVADGSYLFYVYCAACIDGFSVALEREQPDDSVRPIARISRATPDIKRHWARLDSEAGSILWAIKQLRGCLWSTKFRNFSDQKRWRGGKHR